MADTGNINTAVNAVAGGASTVINTGVGLIGWGQKQFGQYALIIFGLIGMFFLTKIFKIKL